MSDIPADMKAQMLDEGNLPAAVELMVQTGLIDFCTFCGCLIDAATDGEWAVREAMCPTCQTVQLADEDDEDDE